LKLLGKCILCVHQGQVWASSDELLYLLAAVAQPVPMRFTSVTGNSLLSARELDVVRCVAEGLSNREIASRLTLREHTVKNYLFRIFDKLGVSSRVEVVLYALSGRKDIARPATGATGHVGVSGLRLAGQSSRATANIRLAASSALTTANVSRRPARAI